MGELDRERLTTFLGRVVPAFESLGGFERLSGGASQETYRVEVDTAEGLRTLCLRRAAGGTAAPDEDDLREGVSDLHTEALLMEAAREAGIPEPAVLHVLEPEDGLGDGFLMEWMEGETLGARIVRSAELAEVRPRLARQCGEILARIHSIDVEAAGLVERLRELPPGEFLRETRERYERFDSPQPMIDWVARWLEEHLPESPRTTLVHNDFRNGNLMISPEGIVAVLDWELAHVGDPMRDLGWICCNSWRFGRSELPVGGFGTRDELFAGYESVSGIPVDPEQVRWWEVFGSFWWAVGCLAMADHYRHGPDRSVERPAIGRRSSECQVDCVNLLIPGPVELVEPEPYTDADMPRIDELIESVRDHLRNEIAGTARGRSRFLAVVAANSLDIVQRDLTLGGRHRELERQRLAELLGSDGDLLELRRRLAEGLRDGSIALDHPGLEDHLRTTVVNQVAIDQPSYSGFRTAIATVG